jgi:hypothetical protein
MTCSAKPCFRKYCRFNEIQKNFLLLFAVQRLDLQKKNPVEGDAVRGQIVISLISRDRGSGMGPSVTDVSDAISRDPHEVPEGYVLGGGGGFLEAFACCVN